MDESSIAKLISDPFVSNEDLKKMIYPQFDKRSIFNICKKYNISSSMAERVLSIIKPTQQTQQISEKINFAEIPCWVKEKKDLPPDVMSKVDFTKKSMSDVISPSVFLDLFKVDCGDEQVEGIEEGITQIFKGCLESQEIKDLKIFREKGPCFYEKYLFDDNDSDSCDTCHRTFKSKSCVIKYPDHETQNWEGIFCSTACLQQTFSVTSIKNDTSLDIFISQLMNYNVYL